MNRTDIVTAARTWIGTPYMHQARHKGVGVDCIGLVIGVARELQMVPAGFDVNGYSRVPDRVSLMRHAHLHMTLVSIDTMQEGDVVVVSFDRDPQHFGILATYRPGVLSIIHAASHHGKVVEHRLMFSRSMSFVAAFKLPGVV